MSGIVLSQKEWEAIHDTVVDLQNQQRSGEPEQDIEATKRRLIRTMVVGDSELRHHETSYLLVETAIKAIQEMLPGGKTRALLDSSEQSQIKALLNHEDDSIRKNFIIQMAQAHLDHPNDAQGFLAKIKEIAKSMTPDENPHHIRGDTFI